VASGVGPPTAAIVVDARESASIVARSAIRSELLERPAGVEQQAFHVGLKRLELRKIREQVGMWGAVGRLDNQDYALFDGLSSNHELIAVAGKHPVRIHEGSIGPRLRRPRGRGPKTVPRRATARSRAPTDRRRRETYGRGSGGKAPDRCARRSLVR